MQYERRCWPAKMCLWKSRFAFQSRKEKSSSPSPKQAKPYFAHESAFVAEGVEIGASASIWYASPFSKEYMSARIARSVGMSPLVAMLL